MESDEIKKLAEALFSALTDSQDALDVPETEVNLLHALGDYLNKPGYRGADGCRLVAVWE
ncbi:hypothetical protein ACQE3E_23220 (plasmid) [Methylomonas sp. MED-D]|uniref:hypothetical protein n=1 Tax=unclassified Methylomonas TaxID=2608980 RepID=UPI003D08AEF8